MFDHSGSRHRTVGTYAILDFGFKIKHADGSASPAGAIVRQAHERAKSYGSMLNPNLSREIELLLREYGLTSAGAYRNQMNIELINIQGTKSGAVIDFGGFIAVDKFVKNARYFYENDKVLIRTNQKDFVQPNPKIRVPMAQFGPHQTIEDPKADKVWVWSHELAEALASGKADRSAAEQHLRNLLGPVEEVFAKNPRAKSCRSVF